MSRAAPFDPDRHVYELLDPTFHTLWDWLVRHSLIALVPVNGVAVVLASVPAFAARFAALFDAVEPVSVVVATLEQAPPPWSFVEHAPRAGAGEGVRSWVRRRGAPLSHKEQSK